MPPVEVRDNGTSRPDGLVEEKNGSLGRPVAEPVVIDDFDHRQVIRSGNGLRKFVVVDKDELPRGPLEKVTLGKDALQPCLAVEHGENEFVGEGHAAAGQFERGVAVEFFRYLLERMPGDHGAAGKNDACGGVPRGNNDGHACGLCFSGKGGINLGPACDDKRAHSTLEGGAVHVLAIADEEHGACGFEIAEAAGEGVGVHRGHHEGIRLFGGRERSSKRASFKCPGDIGEAGQHFAGVPGRLARGHDQSEQLVFADRTVKAQVFIHHGKGAQAFG